MYIVAIAWIYVVLLMVVTSRSVVSATIAFIFYGILPLALFLWLMGTPHRRRLRSMRMREGADPPDRKHTEGDQ